VLVLFGCCRNVRNQSFSNEEILHFLCFRICRISLRYIFIPFLQLESPTFVKLGKAFVDGMSSFIPFSSYESHLFLTRRLTGVPGYQYDIDMRKEVLQRQIFSVDELNRFSEEFQKVVGHEYRRHMVFDEKMYLVETKRKNVSKSSHSNEPDKLDDTGKQTKPNYKTINPNDWNRDIDKLVEFLGLENSSELLISEVEEENNQIYFNDRKFNELSEKDKYLVKLGIHQINMFSYKLLKPLYEAALSYHIYTMEKFMKNQKCSK
jgi:hypothetical protein